MLGNLQRLEREQEKSAHPVPRNKGEPDGTGSEMNFSPEPPKNPRVGAGGRLRCGTGDSQDRGTQLCHLPAGQSKEQGGVPGGDKPHSCRVPGQGCPPKQPCGAQAAVYGFRRQQGRAWALCGILTATPGQVPGPQSPWGEIPVLPQKEKSASSNPEQLLMSPTSLFTRTEPQ